jgi:dethiobiotin synthetase
MKKSYFVTGIGTDVGKTIASAVLCELLQADYWKPIQSGSETDKSQIKNLVNSPITIHKEKFHLTQPLSPHAAANIDKVQIELKDFSLPDYNENLIIEGAGGLLVPINNQGITIANLINHLNQEVILISRNYLGSINHTLLTIEAVKSRNISIKGIIYIGEELPQTEEIINQVSSVNTLFRIPHFELLNKESISNFVASLKNEGVLQNFN